MKKALKDALAKLDPANDLHWTENGAPAVAAVNDLAEGDERFTREDITKGAPKLTRESAQAAADAAGEDAEGGATTGGTEGLHDLTNPPADGETDTTPPDEQLADPEAPNEGFKDSPAQDEGNKDANGQLMTARKAEPNAKTPAPKIVPERKGEATTPEENAKKVGDNTASFDHAAHDEKIKAEEDTLNALKKQHLDIGNQIAASNKKLDSMYTLRDKYQELPSATAAIQAYHKSVYGA